MIEDALGQAASRTVAQYIVEHAAPSRLFGYPCRGPGAYLGPENNEQRSTDQQEDDHLEEKVERKPSLLEDELPHGLLKKHHQESVDIKRGTKQQLDKPA
ncbi:UNVERIFIED_CONTAM: hypothetical protein Slati_2506700 [Sesamum latifolium]|uniref:Uncharacterized protein n=1 Tax=Sesamum latifolium TaxID=2727402 RepID=A0AAW2WIH5_9LAMI